MNARYEVFNLNIKSLWQNQQGVSLYRIEPLLFNEWQVWSLRIMPAFSFLVKESS